MVAVPGGLRAELTPLETTTVAPLDAALGRTGPAVGIAEVGVSFVVFESTAGVATVDDATL